MNDWVGMWMGHVLQLVWLQGRDPFKGGERTRAEASVGEDMV